MYETSLFSYSVRTGALEYLIVPALSFTRVAFSKRSAPIEIVQAETL